MGPISVNNVNGSLTSKRGKVIPVLNWELTTSQTPEKVKFRGLYTSKKKLPKGLFIDTDGLPAVMTYTIPTTLGSATVLGHPILGKTYAAIFKMKGRQLKIFANIWITVIKDSYYYLRHTATNIEFCVVGQVTIGSIKRTKKHKKSK